MVGNEVTIVCIEDDEGHARLIQRNLQRAGVTNPIVHFDNGSDALAWVKEHAAQKKPMLVLLDLNLPGMHGTEILRSIRSTPETHTVPVVILTTTDDPTEVKQCYDLGCSIYVTKPVDYEALSDAVRKLGLFFSVVKVPGE
jgi:CheY-like chemotaxis protein